MNTIGGLVGAALCVFGVLMLRNDDTESNSGWVLVGIGGLFVVLWLLGLLIRSGEKAIMQRGTPGMCEILTMSTTGVIIGERPQLKLQVRTWTEGSEPQIGEVRRAVGHDMIGRLQPGAVLPIRFAPGDDNNWLFDKSAPPVSD